MRCRECGLEVDNDKAFCPVCGAPMKVTADYEYIQAEIANKVDQFFNDDKEPEEELADEIRSEEPQNESMAKTRNIFGSDSIFDDDHFSADDYREEPSKQRQMEPDFSGLDDAYPEDELYPEENLYPDEEIPDLLDEGFDDEDPLPGRAERHPGHIKRKPSERRLRSMVPYEDKDRTTAKIITVLIIFLIIAAAAVGIMAILGVFSDNKDGTSGDGTRQVVSSLTCNVEAGATYSAPLEITINSATEGNVFYTLDGSEPTTVSKIYTGPFTVSAQDIPYSYPTVHFRAVSFSVDSEKSGEINMDFDLEYNEEDAAMVMEMQTTAAAEPETTTVITVSAPLITPVSGSYSEDTQIIVSSPDGADIFYTYDGTVPSTGSNLYTEPVQMMPGTQVFSAICVREGIQSGIVSNSYTLEYNYPYSAEEAMQQVTNELLWDGYINDRDLSTNDGYVRLTHAGVHEIDWYTYYIIKVDFYNANGTLDKTEYRGVGVNHGNVYFMAMDENGNYYETW